MNDERRESLGPDAEKLDRVREEMREYWRQLRGIFALADTEHGG